MNKETLRKLTEPKPQPKIFDVEPNYQDFDITVKIGKLNAAEWDEVFIIDKFNLALFLELDLYEDSEENLLIKEITHQIDPFSKDGYKELHTFTAIEKFEFTEEDIRNYLKSLNKI